jgi:hypothetical protein
MCKLNEKLKEWENWYSEDQNSVCAQISDMLLDAAVFYAINEARKYATIDAQGNPELNWLVHNFIDRSFLKTQALLVRRLCDGRKDVISLRRLINDMEENKSLLTRENILSAFGYPYDYEKVIKEGCQTNNSTIRFNGAQSEIVHKNIDLLTGVKPEQRQQNDTVQDGVFDRLNKWLDKCEPIVNSVNKIVAHAATPESREKVPAKDLKISLARIHKAHCRIVRIAAFIGQVVLYKSVGLTHLPSYAGNKFEHFEKPLITKNNIEKLKNSWDRYDKHIKQLSERPERRII